MQAMSPSTDTSSVELAVGERLRLFEAAQGAAIERQHPNARQLSFKVS